jgi:hypothetical protein
MTFRPEHEIYRRRLSRNVGVGVVLGCFVALVFALTVVKVKNGDMMHANDAPGLLGSTQPIVPAAPKVTP